jgi:hypothetical protein
LTNPLFRVLLVLKEIRGYSEKSQTKKEGAMGKRILILVILPVLICALAGVAQAWQGRMGGMEDPYGLVQDESDYLIHPAKIANGDGVRFYGDYSLNYTNVTDWKHRVDAFTPGGVWSGFYRDDVSGEEFRHNALVGTAFPLGPGRMGLFFTYAGMKADNYEGHYADSTPAYATLEMKNDLDNFALRLIYGLPIGGGFKLGAEARIAYCQEQKQSNLSTLTEAFLNLPVINPGVQFYPTLAYMWPYKSKYWEALFKGSMEGKVGPFDLEFTLRGGFDFGGTNKWNYKVQALPSGTPTFGWDTKGDVEGWQIGGDLWLRYTVAQDLTLPFLVKVDYGEKTRDGNGPGFGGAAGDFYDYKDETKNLAITVGGGVDKAFGKDTKIAAGIYYNYLQETDDYSINFIYPLSWQVLAYTFPDSMEHQILLRLAGEHAFSPVVALRAGIDFFYGWVIPKEKATLNTSGGTFDIVEGSGHGCPHWGIGGSLGGTIKVRPFTLEPFVGGGYQQLRQKWSTEEIDSGVLTVLYDEKLPRTEWNAGMGLSILFNL